MEFLQTIDWAAILKIIGIDIMLGVDNAIVIALACASLPPALRKKAVFLGTAGAVGLRAVLLVFAGFLMKLSYIKLIAGLYLLFIGYKLLADSEGNGDHAVAPADRVFSAVKTILVADFMMSLDNVLAVAGAAEGAGAHSTMYAIAGIIFSIPVIIFGATTLMGVMQRFPAIVWMGGGLLGWVGVEMAITDSAVAGVTTLHQSMGSMTHTVFKITGFALVISAVLLSKAMSKKKNDDDNTIVSA